MLPPQDGPLQGGLCDRGRHVVRARTPYGRDDMHSCPLPSFTAPLGPPVVSPACGGHAAKTSRVVPLRAAGHAFVVPCVLPG